MRTTSRGIRLSAPATLYLRSLERARRLAAKTARAQARGQVGFPAQPWHSAPAAPANRPADRRLLRLWLRRRRGVARSQSA
jgi:hypothetical protein